VCAHIVVSASWARSGCAPRSASRDASITLPRRTGSPPTSGSSLATTPLGLSDASDRSRRPTQPTPAGCWSSLLPLPPRPSRRRSARAPPARPSTRNHQHLLEGPTPPERSPAPTQGRPPRTGRDRRCRNSSRAHRRPLGNRNPHNHRPNRHLARPLAPGSPTRAEPRITSCGWRGGPSTSRLAHTTPRFVA